MYSVSADDFTSWRIAARQYLNAGIAPAEIQWQSGDQESLFGQANMLIDEGRCSATEKSRRRVPPSFVTQLEQASCYLDQQYPARKWSIFYSLLWRITQVDRKILSIKSDPEVKALAHMCKSVNRDMHKMKAFVRFKSSGYPGDSSFDVAQLSTSEDSYYSAWFEPEHLIVEKIAPFFVKRFTGMNWSILTPRGCAHWDKQSLLITPGVTRPHIREDEFDSFWRAYYCSIFNPARLKEQAMKSEMPKKYWKNLPESQCINGLATGSSTRMNKMIEIEPTDAERIRKQSQTVTNFQDELRKKNRQ